MALAGYASAVLNNGLCRYEAAMDGAKRASDDGDFGYSGAALSELVEAATRAGEPEVAAAALPRLEERTRAAGTDWALGVLARSRALIDRRARTPTPSTVRRSSGSSAPGFASSSPALVCSTANGSDATAAAWTLEDSCVLRTRCSALAGAEAFAERARRELLATGETVARRTAETRDYLTRQEAQIARLAADGHTNPEIGAQLFISPRTVEYHLRKVFTKLDVSSRRELRGALPDDRPVLVSS